MTKIHIAAAALNQTPLDWQGNTQRILRLIEEAKNNNIHLLNLPEMSLCGYGCEDAFYFPETAQRSLIELDKILPATRDMMITLGFPLLFEGLLYNVIALIANGELVGIVPKKTLANDGVYYEARWFKAWPLHRVVEFELPPMTHQASLKVPTLKVPMGDIYFDWMGIPFGFEICEEAWTQPRFGTRLAQEGVKIILNPSGSHFAFQKHEKRKSIVVKGSQEFDGLYVYSNLVGNESGRLIFDGSLLIAHKGQLIAESKRFSFKDHDLLIYSLDPSQWANPTKITATKNPLAPRPITLRWTPTLKDTPVPQYQEALPSALSLNEEFEQAVALGLFDYLRKSHSHGFAISLSGGIDSAVVTVLAHSALERAFATWGLEELKKRLPSVTSLQKAATFADLKKAMVYSVYQSTAFSSMTTRKAAQELAKALGITFFEWSVEQINSSYKQLIEKALLRPLDWETDDLALQNIQARVRAPSIWLLANTLKLLLLATSNRSEASVGYATMDGDTAGGLSPLAGIDKKFLQQWVRWKAEDLSPSDGGIPALSAVYQMPPTAELRPPQQSQTDEADLMPYDVLASIEKNLIHWRKSPHQTLPDLIREFPQHTKEKLQLWLERFCRLWTQNQWKRERYAPSFHLDEYSVDPKTWCRFPILSGGFDV